MENETNSSNIFDMGDLMINLPQKRGLSRYYSGKSRSFACLADVHTLDDLKKKILERQRRGRTLQRMRVYKFLFNAGKYQAKLHPLEHA